MSTFTKEQLRERAREKVKSLEFAVTQTAFADSRAELEEELELARITLASLEAEAVGYMNRFTGRVFTLEEQPGADTDSQVYVPLYTAPPSPVAVPEGYRLQPISEYDAMCAAMLQGAENVESRCSNSPVIPNGWKLVPIELTGDMTNAMSEAILDDLHNVDVWRSVLAAAPQQE